MDFKKSQQYIAEHRFETIQNLCRFATTDVLLFWNDEEDIFALQKKCWQPILDSLNNVFKLEFITTTELNVPENEASINKLKHILNDLTDKELTGCFLAASEIKSVLLGLLLAKQKIPPSEAFSAAFLEELYQNKFWGKDPAALNLQEKTKQHLYKIAEYIKIK